MHRYAIVTKRRKAAVAGAAAPGAAAPGAPASRSGPSPTAEVENVNFSLGITIPASTELSSSPQSQTASLSNCLCDELTQNRNRIPTPLPIPPESNTIMSLCGQPFEASPDYDFDLQSKFSHHISSFFSQDNLLESSQSNFFEDNKNTADEAKSDVATGMQWWDQDTIMMDQLPPSADTDYGVGSASRGLDSSFCGQFNPELALTVQGEVLERQIENGEKLSAARPKHQSL